MARTGIFGRSGSGKSWYLGWVLERVISEVDYAIHFDVHDEELALSDKEDPLLKTFYVDEEFAHKRVEYDGREMPLITAVILDQKKIRVVPDGLTDEEKMWLFNEVCKAAMEISRQDFTFHISADEAHQVVPDIGDNLPEEISRVLTGGRKRGVEWTLSTQRPSNLHKEAYTQMNMAAYFSLTKDNDVGKVNGSCGFNAYEILPGLEPRQYVLENLDSGELMMKSTNDLSRNRDHFAGDDGVSDEILNESVEDGVDLRDRIAEENQVNIPGED